MEWCLDCHRAPERYLRPQRSTARPIGRPANRAGLRGQVPRQHAGTAAPRVTDGRENVPPGTRRPAGRAPPRRVAGARPLWKASTSSPRRRPSSTTCSASSRSRRLSSRTRRAGASCDMGASLALAGLAACTKQPRGVLRTCASPPRDWCGAAPSSRHGLRPRRYAPRHPRGEPRGAPTEIEGNPDHPLSLARPTSSARRTCSPLRPRSLPGTFQAGEERSWAASARRSPRCSRSRSRGGARACPACLTGRTTSPTLAAHQAAIQAALPEARLVAARAPLARQHARRGAARLRRAGRGAATSTETCGATS